MSKIKNRLLQLIEIRGISKREFCRQIDVSHTYLNGDSEIGSDKLEVIISVFPELSLEWLLTGKGSMLKMVENNVEKNTDNRLWALIESQQRQLESQQRTIEALAKKGDAGGVTAVAR